MRNRFLVEVVYCAHALSSGCSEVYNSRGSGVRDLVTLFAPHTDDGANVVNLNILRVSRRLCLGYYAHKGDTAPPEAKTLRITDQANGSVVEVSLVTFVIQWVQWEYSLGTVGCCGGTVGVQSLFHIQNKMHVLYATCCFLKGHHAQ
jgi:hypothetical protein